MRRRDLRLPPHVSVAVLEARRAQLSVRLRDELEKRFQYEQFERNNHERVIPLGDLGDPATLGDRRRRRLRVRLYLVGVERRACVRGRSSASSQAHTHPLTRQRHGVRRRSTSLEKNDERVRKYKFETKERRKTAQKQKKTHRALARDVKYVFAGVAEKC